MRILYATAFKVIMLLSISSVTSNLTAQCTWYTITVTDGVGAPDVTWELIDAMGVTWTSGNAPWVEDICLPDGCYTLLMYDSNSNGWGDIDWFIQDWTGDFDFDTNLADGPHGTATFVLGADQPCDPANGGGCPIGTTTLQFIVSNGSMPADVSWDCTWNGTVIASGGAGYNDTLCLSDGCFVLYMVDAASNGWNGATYTLKYFGGAVLYTGTLAAGGVDSVLISIGGVTCSWGGGGGPGPGPGGGCGTVVHSGDPGADCPTVLCVCDPFTFPIRPSGFGSIDEIPPAGSISNPAFGGGIPPPPWGGMDFGCLLAGELNSSWMMITISTPGNLGFGFGLGGQQVGFYDWAMWPYTGAATCTTIFSDVLPPARCVWNAVPYGGTGLANTIPPGGDPGNFAPELPVLAGQRFIICLSNWSFVTTDVTLDFFGSASISCIPELLPVELMAFGSSCEEDGIVIQWSTASEQQNDHFDVERSSNGMDWEIIGTVEGAGYSQQRVDYTFRDDDLRPAGTYYRLREVDTAGEGVFSDIIHEQGCGTDLILRQWLIDGTGKRCGTWPAPSGAMADGIYLLRTEYVDGRIRTKKLAIVRH